MPKTRLQNIIFTLIMAFVMVTPWSVTTSHWTREE